MALILRNRTDIEDLTRGCTFFGTGGGGDMELGLKMLYPHVDEGVEIEIVDVESIGDDDWLACPYYSGTIAPPTPEIEEKRTRFPWDYYEKELAEGLAALEEHMGLAFAAAVPFELGGVNTPAPIDAAVKHGIPCVDGDYTGRAVPEICQNTVCSKGFSMAPLALVDWYGDKTIVHDIINYEMGERISKALSEAAWGRVGNVGFPVRGAAFREAVIPDTLSKSYSVGRIIRESQESGDSPADRIVSEIGGWILFEGTVEKKDWENREGYMWGETIIDGESDLKDGSTLKIWFKNENHVTWIDDEPWVTSPDIIEIINRKSGEPITNTDLKKGDNVSVIGMKAPDNLREPNAVKVLSPQYFGFDIEYSKIEDVI